MDVLQQSGNTHTDTETFSPVCSIGHILVSAINPTERVAIITMGTMNVTKFSLRRESLHNGFTTVNAYVEKKNMNVCFMGFTPLRAYVDTIAHGFDGVRLCVWCGS